MNTSDTTWTLTRKVRDSVDPATDPRVACLARLGAAILLFQECDPAMADRLTPFADRLTGARQDA